MARARTFRLQHFDHLWLSTPAGIWRCELVTGDGADISEDVLMLETIDRPFESSAYIRLKNENGKYGAPGSVRPAYLSRGSRIEIDPGYRTTEGLEACSGQHYRIESVGYTSKEGESNLVLLVYGGWQALEYCRARRQVVWEGDTTVFGILQAIFAGAGFALACP